MLDEKDLQAIANLIDDRLDVKLQPIKDSLDELREAEAITRDGVNALLEWAEDVSNAIRFPLPRVGDHKDA